MKLKDLINYADNNNDKTIYNALIQSEEKEIINYIVNVTSDLLNGIFLPEEFKTNGKNNLSKYSKNEIGQIATFMAITPYAQASMQNLKNWQEKATSFLEIFIGYIVGTIDKKEFFDVLSQMKSLLNLSDKFYDNLVIFFSQNSNYIRENIIKKL